ncbi:hypothetical protein BV898_17850 [Hypsibius exemplaris]|uniref:ERAP1-like C-terminal domain-containing protein n=1 Tax=Hypsibius exemplaris TaxID=2072580 RepID=A0A9X6RMV3_HYPEX|nr:hypothetical protein BV898_17850 [Hypsibius exemplaris]
MFCYGVRHGPVENWHYLRGLYDHPEITTSDQRMILRSLACTKYEELVERLLAMALDGKSVRPQDGFVVFGAFGRRWVRQLYADVGGKDAPESAAFERAIERAQINIAWMALHADEVGGVLKTLTVGEPSSLLF